MQGRYGTSVRLLTLTSLASLIFLTCASSAEHPQSDEGAEAEVEPRDYVFVQAHRGSTTEYPELTLAAFEAALEAGADRIEMDLAITSDDHIVLMHDTSVNRTTDGSGRVESHSLEEIQQLDAGSWHSEQFAGEHVPSLREVIELVRGRAELNLDVKSYSRPGVLVSRVIERAVETVKEMEAEEWVVYSSFDLPVLQEIREHAPDARLMLIDWGPPSSYDGLDAVIDQDMYAWTTSADYVDSERPRRARREGVSSHVGSGPGAQAREYIELGFDGLSSGNPQALVEFLEEEGYRDGEYRDGER